MEVKEVLDKREWNTFVKRVAPYAFFQSWEWGEVEKVTGHKVERFGLYEDSELCGVAQAVFIYARRGRYMHVRHGPVLESWEEGYFNSLLGYLKDKAAEENLNFMRLGPRIKLDDLGGIDFNGFISAPIHNMGAEVSYVVDLEGSEEDLLMQMRKNTRYSIRKALKNDNLVVEHGSSSELLEDLMELFRKTAQRKNFVVEREVEDELGVFSSSDMADAEVVVVYSDGNPLAGALVDFWGDRGIYRFAAASREGLKKGVSYLVVWEAMKLTKRRGFDFFDLWGGISDLDDEDHPWYGLTVFKRGFGGNKVVYVHERDLSLKIFYWKTYIIELLIKYIRGYDTILGVRAPGFLRELIGV